MKADDSVTAEQLAEALLNDQPETVDPSEDLTNGDDMESKQDKDRKPSGDSKPSNIEEGVGAETTDAAAANEFEPDRVPSWQLHAVSADIEPEFFADLESKLKDATPPPTDDKPSVPLPKVRPNKQMTQMCLDLILKAQEKVANFHKCMLIDSASMA